MEADEMLDVIHYFFEEDMKASSAEEVEANSKMRVQLYDLYGIKYRYGVSSTKESNSGGRKYITDGDNLDFNSDLGEFGSDSNVTKEYFEPTDFDPDAYLPFGGALDAPLG